MEQFEDGLEEMRIYVVGRDSCRGVVGKIQVEGAELGLVLTG